MDQSTIRNTLSAGVFTISIDTEIAWGAVHHGNPETYRDYSREREVIDALLCLFEKYDIRATWAVVGHLFLDRCQPVNGIKHPEISRSRYSWCTGDWFDADPCADQQSNPYWYGKDVINRIESCTVPQEVGCHSFAHIIVGDPECSAETFDMDLKTCRKIAAEQGITLRSFVYPRNVIGKVETLSKNDFIAYRGRAQDPFSNAGKFSRRILRAIDTVRPQANSVAKPSYESGIWNIPQTYFYSPSTSRFRHLPVAFWSNLIGRRIQQVASGRGLFHMWFHPHDITAEPEVALKGIERILELVAELRTKRKIENLTMGELADKLQLSEARSVS